MKSYERAGLIAQETLSSIRTVLALGLEKILIQKYSDNLLDAENTTIRKGLVTGLLSAFSGTIIYISYGVAIMYGIYLTHVYSEVYNGGLIIQAFFNFVSASYSLGQSIPYLLEMTEARISASKIFSIIDEKSKIDVFENHGFEINDFKGSIKFENVSFSYPQRNNIKILDNLNINIPHGKTVAFVGSSGCGKSTIISLLQRFYLPTQGKIKIDDVNVDDLNLKWLRNQMALVSQEPILFANSIKENIRLGRLDATDDEIIEAAKMANAHNFIMQLQSNYDTQVGERGTN